MELGGQVNVVEPSEPLLVGGEHDAVRASDVHTNPIVAERVGGVEVEHEDKARALVRDDLVALVLERDPRLWRREPAVLVLEVMHRLVELVQVPVPQHGVVHNVPLAPSVVEGVAVALAGEVEPLRVTELVAFEIEVAFAAERVDKEPWKWVSSRIIPK